MTDPTPEGAMMSQADHDSVDYPNTDKVTLYIFTNPEHPVSNDEKVCATKAEKDVDIDVKTLMDLAELYNYDVHGVSQEKLQEKRHTKEELLNILGAEPEQKEGVFVFVFLTFKVDKDNDSEKFYAGKESEVTLNDVWDKIKRNPCFTGRPKIILLQADDISLLKTPETPKGELYGSVIEPVKLPLECDRLTMISNIPQPGKFRRSVGPTSGKGDAPKASPSLLIQAFADVMQENLKREDTEKWDLSEMSVYMNSKIQQGINELKGLKKDDGNDVIDKKHHEKMIRHPVVSTLRKDLYFKKNMEKRKEEEE